MRAASKQAMAAAAYKVARGRNWRPRVASIKEASAQEQSRRFESSDSPLSGKSRFHKSWRPSKPAP